MKNRFTCSKCGVLFSDRGRHYGARRCDSQGKMGVKAGKQAGTPMRRVSG